MPRGVYDRSKLAKSPKATKAAKTVKKTPRVYRKQGHVEADSTNVYQSNFFTLQQYVQVLVSAKAAGVGTYIDGMLERAISNLDAQSSALYPANKTKTASINEDAAVSAPKEKAKPGPKPGSKRAPKEDPVMVASPTISPNGAGPAAFNPPPAPPPRA